MVVAPEVVVHSKWGRQISRSPSLSDCLYENAPAHVLFVTTVSMCKKNVSMVRSWYRLTMIQRAGATFYILMVYHMKFY